MSDKATTVRRGKRLDAKRRAELIEAARIYYPPETGIHICGSDDVSNAAITLGSFPMPEAAARFSFAALKAELAEPDGQNDVIVDLCVRGDIVDDFGMRRQMMDRLRRALA